MPFLFILVLSKELQEISNSFSKTQIDYNYADDVWNALNEDLL